MYKRVLIVGFVASAGAISAAGRPVPAALHLRGGGGFSALTEMPAVLDSGYGTANKLQISTTSDLNDGTNLQTTFLRTAADSISAVLKAATRYRGVDIEGTLDGSGSISVKASKDAIVDGVDLTIETSLAGGAKIADIATPKVTADYDAGDMTASVSVAGSTLDASATYTSGDICVGAATTYDSGTGSLSDPSIAASYAMGPTSFTGSMNGLGADDLTATVSHVVSNDLSVAGAFASKDTSFSLGAAYTIDRDSSVQGKINSDGVLNVGYALKLTDGASMNAGLQIDTNNMDSRKLGVSLVVS